MTVIYLHFHWSAAVSCQLTVYTKVLTPPYVAASNSTLVNLDVISDFTANTVSLAAPLNTAALAATRNGDVLSFTALAAVATQAGVGPIRVSVQTNSTDAQIFLQNISADATADEFAAALDSSTGRLFVDLDANGTVDSVVQLTGVTTITAAAFVVV